jgi:PAS domain S-box-containing protein
VTNETKKVPRHLHGALQVRHDAALGELERYKILVDSVQDYAIFSLDTDGRIVSWNKGAQKIKGYTADEIVGQHFSKFYLARDIEANKPARELELAKKMGRVEDEDWRVRKDGETFWANVVITALYGPDGELIGFAKVTRDLTERKAQEDSLHRANSQLQKQQIELERLNLSKDEFMSLASHQLRTPATVVKQLLGMLLEGLYGDVPEDLIAVISKAYNNNERQIHIVNSLLKVAQLDAGKVIIRKTPLKVAELLKDIAQEYAETSSVHGQKVTVDLSAPQPLELQADVDNLRMAICNLMDNAIKYTPEGGEITLKLSRQSGEAVIEVVDTGVGIDQADISKLFGKFVRLQNSLSQKAGGSGLGLYWVYKIIEVHGGRIEVDSTLGQGTTFRVFLPILESKHA